MSSMERGMISRERSLDPKQDRANIVHQLFGQPKYPEHWNRAFNYSDRLPASCDDPIRLKEFEF
jgi:hypothetical protein